MIREDLRVRAERLADAGFPAIVAKGAPEELVGLPSAREPPDCVLVKVDDYLCVARQPVDEAPVDRLNTVRIDQPEASVLVRPESGHGTRRPDVGADLVGDVPPVLPIHHDVDAVGRSAAMAIDQGLKIAGEGAGLVDRPHVEGHLWHRELVGLGREDRLDRRAWDPAVLVAAALVASGAGHRVDKPEAPSSRSLAWRYGPESSPTSASSEPLSRACAESAGAPRRAYRRASRRFLKSSLTRSSTQALSG